MKSSNARKSFEKRVYQEKHTPVGVTEISVLYLSQRGASFQNLAHGKTPFGVLHVEASLNFHIFTSLDSSRLCSTKSGRTWTARHRKPFYWDTRETPRHMRWALNTGQRQGH